MARTNSVAVFWATIAAAGFALLAVRRRKGRVVPRAIKRPALAPDIVEELKGTFERDGVVIVKGVLPASEILKLRQILEHIITTGDIGGRIDASTEGAHGQFIMELDAGRWHVGLREFAQRSSVPALVAQLLGAQSVRFFMDHVFLKEPGSQGRTEYHQDLPFFPLVVGSQAAVCWLPVDTVTRDNGAMGYVPGSHRWSESQPTNLMSHGNVPNTSLPDILGHEEEFRVRYFDAEPGDVILHHPATVHGSAGNVTTSSRRLAVSLRYVGDDVKWRKKDASLIHVPFLKATTQSKGVWIVRDMCRNALRWCGIAPAGSFESDYGVSALWSYQEMCDDEPLDARDCARSAFPVVWPTTCSTTTHVAD